jgi:hypothetical protein
MPDNAQNLGCVIKATRALDSLCSGVNLLILFPFQLNWV